MKYLKFGILGIAFILSSCESETILYYYLHNNTDGTVTVSGQNVISNATIDIAVEPKTTVEIGTWSKLGKETDVFTAKSIFGSGLEIKNDRAEVCTKDYLYQENWILELEDDQFVATHSYTFSVSEQDFQ
jgi:hypothetical protein